MRRLLVLALAPVLLAADDHSVKFTSGPFELLTDAGRPGRETLVRLEQFRYSLGQMIGENDPQMPLPVRVFVLKNTKGWAPAAPVSEGRATYNVVLDEKTPPGPAIYTELTRLFLAANTGRMPAGFERGLVTFFSTFQVSGIRITAGAPPPQPDLDWARVHLLVVDPEYFGKLHVLLFNLRKGVADDPAYRNAFGKSAAEIEAQTKQHLAAGHFETTSLPNRAMSEKDFEERQVSDADARLARADLLAGSQSAAEYESLIRDQSKVAEAEEGLGILALREQKKDDARKHFAAAMEAGSKSARCYIEYARLEPDNEKANQALLRAAGINSKLDEPFALMAARDTDPLKRLAHWKAAAERNPRNAAYWQGLAESYLEQRDFDNAAKAWSQGEQAAVDPAQRERMRQARMQIEQQRLDYEAAERQKAADELEKLKQQAQADLHALESKYKEDTGGAKPVPWWDGPKPSGKVTGTLKQVDCLGTQARLVIDTGGKLTRLLMPDPKTVALAGGGDQALGCGAQKPRQVTVGYFPKTNTRLSTVGEVATIEFQ